MPTIGEIRLYPFDQLPDGWTPCNGQLLSINQNRALFSLLGTTYGGNGSVTFALPDLRANLAREPAGSSSIGYLATNFCIAVAGIFPQRG